MIHYDEREERRIKNIARLQNELFNSLYYVNTIVIFILYVEIKHRYIKINSTKQKNISIVK